MVDSKDQAFREAPKNAIVLCNHSSYCICIDHILYLRHSAGIFMDEKRLMAIFGRPNKYQNHHYGVQPT
jgi:hypothetical protein